MKVELLKDWAGRKAGEFMELTDTKAKRVIATGLVKKATVAKKKATKPKERKDERMEKTTGV